MNQNIILIDFIITVVVFFKGLQFIGYLRKGVADYQKI